MPPRASLRISEMALMGSGKGASFVAEHFAFEKIGRNRRAVHRHERLRRARRQTRARTARRPLFRFPSPR